MKDFTKPEKWTGSEIRSDFSNYKKLLSSINRDVGIKIINGGYMSAVSVIQSLIDSFTILKEQLYCDVDGILASYYWLNGMLIACALDMEDMRIKVADANLQLAYEVADPELRNNISKIRNAVSQSHNAAECNTMFGFFDDEDNYLALIYRQEQQIAKMIL